MGLTLRWEHVLYLGGGDNSYGLVMDRALVISYLQAAEHNLAIIEQQIANQRGLISR